MAREEAMQQYVAAALELPDLSSVRSLLTLFHSGYIHIFRPEVYSVCVLCLTLHLERSSNFKLLIFNLSTGCIGV